MALIQDKIYLYAFVIFCSYKLGLFNNFDTNDFYFDIGKFFSKDIIKNCILEERMAQIEVKNVILLGGTGEVGKELVKELAKNTRIEKVTLILRRHIQLPGSDHEYNYGKFIHKIIDFEVMANGDKIEEFEELFRGHEAIMVALGTTRMKAGAQAFYRVDHDYILAAAEYAFKADIKHFSLVSSAGANKNSFFLYPQIKGEVDDEITSIKFEKVSIYRPAVLLCDRVESRPFELIIRSLFSYLDYWRLGSVETAALAKVMVSNLFLPTCANTSVEIFTNSEINNMIKQQ